MIPEIRTFRCGHIRDTYNSRIGTGGYANCRTCHRMHSRNRYRRLREEGLTPSEIHGYRPLTTTDLASVLNRMQDGMTICQATAGPSGYHRSTIYRKIRIWASSYPDKISLIMRLSKLNIRKQAERRWQARRPRFDPGTHPRIDPAALDFERIERVVQAVFRTEELQSDLRQALILDLLEGCCCYDNLHPRAMQHKEDHFKNSNSRYGQRSIDEPVAPGATRSFGEVVAWRQWSH
jgi:hypothetical protein